MSSIGIIRKISIGDIKAGITYKVGQRMFNDQLVIEQILHNTENPNKEVYEIYVSELGSEYARIWKRCVNMPVVVEYDISVPTNESV